MEVVLIIAIVVGGSILALAIVGSTVLMAFKIIRGGISPKSKKLEAEGTKTIQEIYKGLSRMEERVESLESVLLDREKKDRVI
jgi:flagellar basal body-associated protein FliL